MTIPDELDENPSDEQVERLQDALANVQHAVLHYRGCAGQIDDDFCNANEHRRIGLDDLPYGEEMVRTKDLPEDLRRAASSLEPESVTMDIFNTVRAVVLKASETLDDCTPLPLSMREVE